MTERDSERIIRQWNREIEDETRREAALEAARHRWRPVVWGVLWVGWLVLLVGLLAHVSALG